MLEDCLVASRPAARTKKPFTLLLSVLTHGILGAVLVLIPLFQNQVLPQVPLFAPLRPPTIAARSIEVVPVSKSSAAAASAALSASKLLTAPKVIPTRIINDAEGAASPTVPFGPFAKGTGSSIASLFDAVGTSDGPAAPLAPPRPPPPPPRPPDNEVAAKETIRRISRMDPSSLLYSVKPTYPRLAVITKVQGAVQLEAVITREGTIDQARIRVISGHVLLVPAAVEAVQQWRYRPTVLNGEPIEVLTTITVNFTLN